MGGLSALKQLLSATAKGAKPVAEAAEIGRYLRGVPKEEYFRNVQSAGSTVPELQKQFDVEFVRGPNNQAFVYPTQTGGMSTAHSAFGAPLSKFIKESENYNFDPSDFELLNYMDPNRPVYTIAAQNSLRGAGGAAQTYPALYNLLHGKGMANISTGLSPINTVRKPFNTIDALLRNPELSESIIPSQQMLEYTGFTPLDYLKMNPDERLGAMALAGSGHGIQKLDREERMLRRFGSGPIDQEAFDFIRNLETSSPLSIYNEYRRLYGKPVGTEIGIGADALKKMNIVDAILGSRQNELPVGITKGLGYREGGLAQVSQCKCHKQ